MELLQVLDHLFEHVGSVFDLVAELAQDKAKSSLAFDIVNIRCKFRVQEWQEVLDEIGVAPQNVPESFQSLCGDV